MKLIITQELQLWERTSLVHYQIIEMKKFYIVYKFADIINEAEGKHLESYSRIYYWLISTVVEHRS